jgi:uncharacterized membrane protein YfcA
MDYHIVLACFAALFAGFIDAIVGGGGLVQVPALFILFPHFAVPRIIGTNRFASFMGTSVAAYQYSKKVKVPWKTVIFAGIGAGTMSYLGAQISSLISSQVLKPIVLILMAAILVYTFFNKGLGQENQYRVKEQQIPWYGLGIGMVIGFYNGFVGPGTGSLLVFGFVSIIGYSFLTGSAVSKFINVVADLASLSFFLSNGYVEFAIALPMMVCNMLGSYLGSRAAILRGNGFVRVFFLLVVSALMLKFGYDILQENGFDLTRILSYTADK